MNNCKYTYRRIDGPCETCGNDCDVAEHDFFHHHPFLGAEVTCGHEEDEHLDYGDFPVEEWECEQCSFPHCQHAYVGE